jgi:hypothetical protein
MDDLQTESLELRLEEGYFSPSATATALGPDGDGVAFRIQICVPLRLGTGTPLGPHVEDVGRDLGE